MKSILAFLLVLISFSSINAQEQEYLWPTEASTFLSSTFGETRTAHFHAGIDIKTWGKEGYKIFATKDGVLHRIAISAKGYGKVIYLKHNDGSYSLYAHLQSFEDQIQEVADSIRFQDYRFEIDEVVEHLGIKFKQGDVIGRSGSSGIGPPHLHFEIRNAKENPFNALRTNLKVKDTRPPVLHSLLFEPLQANASISGTDDVLIIRPEYSKGIYDFGEVTLSGEVGIALDTYDEADEVYNKYAAYEIIMLHEQDTLFQSRLDQYDYEHASDLFIDRAIDPATGRRRFQRLYNQESMSVKFSNPEYCGCFPNQPKSEITIISKDYYGNESIGKLIINRFDALEFEAGSITALDSKNYNDAYFTEDWVRLNGKYSNIGNVDGIPYSSDLYSFSRSSNTVFRDVNGELVQQVSLQPDSKSLLQTEDYKFRIEFDQSTVFEAMGALLPMSTKDLVRTEFTLYPLDYISKKKFSIEYYINEEQEYADQLALFKYNRFKDRWEFVESNRIGNTIHGRQNEFGTYKVIPDTLAPLIGEASIIKNESNQWLIRVEVEDEESGLNYRKAKIVVDGERGIAEYDKEDDFIIYYHPDFKPGKSNSVEIEVEDHAGNKSSKKFKLTNN